MNEDATIRRLEREARERFLGRLGDPAGVNVARVEVSWYWDDPGLGFESTTHEQAGYFLVHATGNEPGVETIYETFDELVSEEMERRRRKLGFHGWETDDTYAA